MKKEDNGIKSLFASFPFPVPVLIVAVTVVLVLEIGNFAFTADETLNTLLKGTLTRLFAALAVVMFAFIAQCRDFLKPGKGGTIRNLIWCAPCLLVVLANFPYYAIITGVAKIERSDLIWLFVFECIATALFEELTFRGIILEIIKNYTEGKNYGKLIAVAVSSAIFAVIHLFNLFSGAGVGATLMQVGYTFLIGAMLAAVMIKTGNIRLCVILHAAFNFGGLLIPELGSGIFQDACFWILTAIAGTVCLGHIAGCLLKNE